MRRGRKRIRPPAFVIKAMAADYAKGMSLIDMVPRYSISPGTISRLLREEGIRIRPRGAPGRFPSLKKMVDLVRSGMRLREVATHCGITTQAVSARLKYHGVDVALLRTSRRKPIAHAKEIAKEYRAGMSLSGLSRKYGYSTYRIRTALRGQGVLEPYRRSRRHAMASISAKEK